MLASLGSFIFEAASAPFAELSTSADWRHARAPRVGARDAAQFVGPGDESIRIEGALIPEAGARYAALDRLRELADGGEAWPFVDGAGRVWGSFVVARLDTRRRHMLVDGVPRVIDFTLELGRVA